MVLSRIVLSLGLAAAALVLHAQTTPRVPGSDAIKRQVKRPVKLDRTGFEFGVFDAGPLLISGQPSEEALRALAKEGYTMVINLRPKEEMQRVAVPESAVLQELGIEYVRIPMNGSETYPYSPETIDKFAEALSRNQGKGKTLLHCTVAYRASYVWTAYLVRHLGMDLNEAVPHGEAINMRNLLEPFLGKKIRYGDGR